MIELVSDPHTIAELVCGPYAQPVQVPVPDSLRSYVFEFALQRMQNLLDDPNRDAWKLGNENDDGLQRKDPSVKNPTSDRKWFFHYKALTFLDLAKEQGLTTDCHADLLYACEFILKKATTAIVPYIEALDKQTPGYAFGRNVLASNHVLRLIVDDAPAITRKLEVASEHTDFTFCTLHLWENRPEFQWYNEKTRTWECVTENEDNPSATFFLGRKAALMTGGKRIVSRTGEQTKEIVPRSGVLQPLIHRVREIGKVEELTTPRLAVVAFFHVPLIL